MGILKNAAGKIKRFNNLPESARKSYHAVLVARQGCPTFVNASGTVSQKHLEMIDYSLRSYFKMNRGGEMGNSAVFVGKLLSKVQEPQVKGSLAKFTHINIISPNLSQYKADVERVYESLSNDANGLSANGNRFCVGTTKTMHMLFPDLFPMLDSRVGEKVLKCSSGKHNTFNSFWKLIETCRTELLCWQQTYGSIGSLLALDSTPTSLTRIFDKCAW